MPRDLRMSWEHFVGAHFEKEEVNQILSSVHWESWIYNSGPGPVSFDFSCASSNQSLALADEYIRLKGSSPSDYSQYRDYTWQ